LRNPFRKHLLLVVLIVLSSVIVGCPHDIGDERAFGTPESAVRQAIADELGMPVRLKVELFAEHAEWVFVAGQPLTGAIESVR